MNSVLTRPSVGRTYSVGVWCLVHLRKKDKKKEKKKAKKTSRGRSAPKESKEDPREEVAGESQPWKPEEPPPWSEPPPAWTAPPSSGPAPGLAPPPGFGQAWQAGLSSSATSNGNAAMNNSLSVRH